MPVSAELQDENDEDFKRGHEELEPPPTTAADKLDKDIIPVTHCHHERPHGSRSPYTMRPSSIYDRDYRHRSPTPSSLAASQFNSHSQDSLNSAHMQSTSSRSEMFIPMLHVRRDLHHKVGASSRPTSTVTSGLVDHRTPNFLSSIPLRKRPIGPDGEPYSRTMGVYGLNRHNPMLKQADELMLPPADVIGANQDQAPMHPPAAVQGNNLPQMMGSPPLISPPHQQHQAAGAAPPRRTGFSIEDIMRR